MSNTIRRNVSARQQGRTTRLLLLVCWVWVVVPLAWGILETVRASLAFLR
jgi:hypothetical protein